MRHFNVSNQNTNITKCVEYMEGVSTTHQKIDAY